MHNIYSTETLSYPNQKNGIAGFDFNCSTFWVVFYPRYYLYTLKILIYQVIHNCKAAAKQSSVSQLNQGFMQCKRHFNWLKQPSSLIPGTPSHLFSPLHYLTIVNLLRKLTNFNTFFKISKKYATPKEVSVWHTMQTHKHLCLQSTVNTMGTGSPK